MSVKAMGWAYDQQLGDPVKKAVLVAIANIADEEGMCWPSMRRIAWMAEVSIRTAQRHVRELEASGFLNVCREQKRDSGAQSSNVYELPMAARQLPLLPPRQIDAPPCHVRQGEGVTGDMGGVTQLRRGEGDSGVTPYESSSELSLELSGEQQQRAGALPAWFPEDAWKAFADMRKRKRQPITDVARGRLIEKLGRLRNAGHDPAAVLLQSVDNGWTGIFEVHSEGSMRRGNGATDVGARNDAAAAEFVRRQAATVGGGDAQE